MKYLQNLLQKFKNWVCTWIVQNAKSNNTTPFVKIKYEKLSNKVKCPTKAYEDDAGLDVYALGRVHIPKGEWRVVRTGLAFEIPQGWHMQIHTRSSYGQIKLRCHLGIVDAGYRNEVLVVVYNDGHDDFVIEEGSKFCQFLFLPVPKLILEEVLELSESNRGFGGFGSTGK